MKYIGLDLSFTNTGVYIIDDDMKDLFFEFKSKPADFSSDIERADHIAELILKEVVPLTNDIAVIAIENYFAGAHAQSLIKLAILGTMIRCRLLDNGYSFVSFAPTSIKKFETGSGNAPKDNMLKSVYKKHGFDTNSNNVADACAIAHLGKAYFKYQNGKRDFAKYELDVLNKIATGLELVKPYKVKGNK